MPLTLKKPVTIPQQIHAGSLVGAIVLRTDDHIAFLDHEPVTTGHTLVCPVRQVDSIFDLSDKEHAQRCRKL
jgi:diadenosine tetraphosphate (Ap4A) HIT family hydrolase